MSIRLIAFCLLLACPAVAQTPPAATSSLQGRVVKWGSADPIAKATVELRRIAAGVSTPATEGVGWGHFVFVAVPPGQHRIAAKRPGT
jgi:hypothetical protein